ncbi:MAG: TonB-dependent receptor [Pseudomonadota bacterium]
MKLFSIAAPSVGLALAMAGFATAAAQDDVIVVRGAFVPDEKRATSEISSLLDSEDFARQGDSDIAAALLRVTGISVVDGKFPVARGLNERYTSATINGVPLPSPEPLRRSVALDLVPTSILAGSLAQKTYSPQLSAEFGGAAIDLETVSVPTESFFLVSGALEYDTQSTFRNGFFYEGSDTDRFGFDDGLRDLPSIANAAARNGVSSVGQDALDTSFENQDTLFINDGTTPINGSASATVGFIIADNADYRLGTTTYVGYSNDWEVRDGFQNRTEDTNFSDIETRIEEDFSETRQNIGLNLFNVTGLEIGSNHEIAVTTFLLRDTLKRAIIGQGFDDDNGGARRREFTDFISRQVWQTQVNGTHIFPSLADLTMDWRVAYGEGRRNSPYERTITRDIEDDGSTLIRQGSREGNSLNFSELNDDNFFAGIDFTLPVDVYFPSFELSFGGAYKDNERDNLRTDFDVAITAPAELRALRSDFIFNDTILGLEGVSEIDVRFNPQASTLFPDASEASLEVYSAYLMGDVEFTDFLRASVGFRFEDSTQESSVGLSGAPLNTFDAIEEDYILPAVTVTWLPFGNLQVRAAYAQTITRPQFRELAPTDFLDPDFGVTLQGNPFLVNTEINNYDVRAEWYFGRGQFVTLGAFYKEIENPIEQFFTGQEGGATSFLNAPEATLWGFEGEFERIFNFEDFLSGDFWLGKELLISTNYTYSDSEVTADDGDTVIINNRTNNTPDVRNASGLIVDGRSLVGQSDHLFNFQIGFQDPENGLTVTALLNYASDRVLFAEGTDALAIAVEEDVPISLDLVARKDFSIYGGEFNFTVAGRNLLGEDFRAFREDDFGNEADFFSYGRDPRIEMSLSARF